MPPRPQPFYARLNQPPRSPHGRNRQAPKKNYSDPLDGAGASTGGATARTIYTPITFAPGGVTYIDPGVSSGLMYMLPGGITYVGADWIKPEPLPIPYTGIHSGELTGHRAWFVTDTYELTSLAHYFVWELGKTIEGNVEEVVFTGAITGIQRFGGVYAYSSFDLLRDDELASAMRNRYIWPTRERKPSARQLSVGDSITLSDYISETVTYLGLAYGTVKLWGETVQHEKGYRASFAKLTSIDGFIGVGGFDLEKLRGKYLS